MKQNAKLHAFLIASVCRAPNLQWNIIFIADPESFVRVYLCDFFKLRG